MTMDALGPTKIYTKDEDDGTDKTEESTFVEAKVGMTVSRAWRRETDEMGDNMDIKAQNLPDYPRMGRRGRGEWRQSDHQLERYRTHLRLREFRITTKLPSASRLAPPCNVTIRLVAANDGMVNLVLHSTTVTISDLDDDVEYNVDDSEGCNDPEDDNER
ncbi:hypothetical protein LTR04_007021 [Oleoguttula sp. CCFEE 6159]|nr:hypothetical protein LTR04_007021 [Oleoguttula sp. CCFEE 6159]